MAHGKGKDKRAPWCDYTGTLPDGRVNGVAIFDHPKNPSHPTWWHVRDYGLFAANPFGKHDFEKLRNQPNAGDIAIPEGGRLVLVGRPKIHEWVRFALQARRKRRPYNVVRFRLWLRRLCRVRKCPG